MDDLQAFPPHLLVDFNREQQLLICDHCGQRHQVKWPCTDDELIVESRRWAIAHVYCLRRDPPAA